MTTIDPSFDIELVAKFLNEATDYEWASAEGSGPQRLSANQDSLRTQIGEVEVVLSFDPKERSQPSFITSRSFCPPLQPSPEETEKIPLDYFYEGPLPSISVGKQRGEEAIAKEIARQLLPATQSKIDEAIATYAGRHKAANERLAVALRACEAMQIPSVRYIQYDCHGLPMIGDLAMQRGIDRVGIEKAVVYPRGEITFSATCVPIEIFEGFMCFVQAHLKRQEEQAKRDEHDRVIKKDTEQFIGTDWTTQTVNCYFLDEEVTLKVTGLDSWTYDSVSDPMNIDTRYSVEVTDEMVERWCAAHPCASPGDFEKATVRGYSYALEDGFPALSDRYLGDEG